MKMLASKMDSANQQLHNSLLKLKSTRRLNEKLIVFVLKKEMTTTMNHWACYLGGGGSGKSVRGRCKKGLGQSSFY